MLSFIAFIYLYETLFMLLLDLITLKALFFRLLLLYLRHLTAQPQIEIQKAPL